jgi:hypothetical protein
MPASRAYWSTRRPRLSPMAGSSRTPAARSRRAASIVRAWSWASSPSARAAGAPGWTWSGPGVGPVLGVVCAALGVVVGEEPGARGEAACGEGAEAAARRARASSSRASCPAGMAPLGRGAPYAGARGAGPSRRASSTPSLGCVGWWVVGDAAAWARSASSVVASATPVVGSPALACSWRSAASVLGPSRPSSARRGSMPAAFSSAWSSRTPAPE